MQKCKICGTRIDEGTTVCPSCGAKVASSNAVPAAGRNADAAAETAKARFSSTTQVIKTTCPSCGAEVIGEHRFCPQCGVNLKEAAEQNTSAPAQQERRCPSCGSIVQANSVFCPDCGASLSRRKPATAPTPQASATAATPAPAPATATNRKVKLTLTPTSLCEVKSNDRSRSLIIFICALFFLVFIIMGGI